MSNKTLVTTPRAQQIADQLLEDGQAYLDQAGEGGELRSRQIRALARAVARHLAALEDVVELRTRP